ncbi:MAG: phosphotransferase, partial [Candidatus Woesearchaeota archaeon]|nr:phosphotransferase [Candidatus Woesearchaeota archaeon]
MMKDIVPLKKNLGRKKYNRFVDSFLKKSLLLKLIRSPAEFSKEQAEELSRLIEHDKFKIDEKYHANVSDGLSIELTATFQNGYTMRSFGKFLRANSHKLEKGSAVEDFLKANYFTGAPAGFHYERLNPDEAFRCTEFLDAAVDKEGMQAIPSKEGLEKTMGEYCTITPNEKITKLLKHDKYSDYFKETFFDAKTKYKKDEQARTEDTWKAKEGFEDLVEKFSALGAEVDKQPQSIVHNDMHRKNLVKLVSAPSSPKIIDWDESIIGAIQKDLWRVNMSVYEHNCANAKDARDASIRKLYEAIQESQKRTDTPRSQYTDSLEEFTRKYLIIDALENLNFTAKAAEFVKKKEGKPEFDFFSNLRDLVYTRALDTLNELGETQLEQRMTEFGKQNGL